MKKIILAMFLLLTPMLAKAEIFGTASTLNPGVVMIGAEGEALIDPNDIMANFHIGYGLMDRFDMDMRFGAGSVPIYIGMDLEYQFIKDDLLDFSIIAGPHFQDETFLDFTPIVSHRFLRFSISTGFDFNYRVTNGTALGISWFMGAAAPITRGMDFLFDFGIRIKDAPHWVSAGVAIYI